MSLPNWQSQIVQDYVRVFESEVLDVMESDVLSDYQYLATLWALRVVIEARERELMGAHLDDLGNFKQT